MKLEVICFLLSVNKDKISRNKHFTQGKKKKKSAVTSFLLRVNKD